MVTTKNVIKHGGTSARMSLDAIKDHALNIKNSNRILNVADNCKYNFKISFKFVLSFQVY